MIKNYINGKNKIKGGYTLIEALIYVAIFVVLSTVVVSLVLSVLETGRYASPFNLMNKGIVTSFETISREIRSSVNIDTANSVLATSTGSLTLNTFDVDGNPRTVRFYLDSNQIKMDENGAFLGPLTPKDLTVTALIFSIASSSVQSLVDMEIDLTGGTGKYQKSEKFYFSARIRVND